MSDQSPRNMVFVSHAAPEDNDLALWMSLQLAKAGYAVWCDLTKLLGGEKFWEDIQQAIQQRTAKFVFILSSASNTKTGTLNELDCALGTEKKLCARDFVFTAKVDSLEYNDIFIGIRRLNHTDFKNSWAEGLAKLLKKLDDDGVPKTPGFNPDSVCSWWRDQFSATAGVTDQEEDVLSNWFNVENIPSRLYEHQLSPIKPGPIGLEETYFTFPTVKISDVSYLSFAPSADLTSGLGSNLTIISKQYEYQEVLTGTIIKDGPRHISQLFRLAWARRLQSALPRYELANKLECFYFSGGLIKDDSIHFLTIDGKKTWRDVVGYKTLPGGRVRHWHYGISGKPILRPETLFVIKGHVLFSDDRQNIWEKKDALARARRNQCKNWWNDEWRDRILATMFHLAEGQEVVSFPVASDAGFTISKFPILFESPVSYLTPKNIEKLDLDDYSLEEENEDVVDEMSAEGQDDPQ